MNARIILFVLGAFLSSNLAYPQAKLVEKVERKGDELVIPYEKYLLDNGLTLIVHEDHSDPIVHVDVTYHVGSAREEIGKSGFAHFFEHMMFQGSDHVADEAHFKIISESGGTLNGTTNRDRTNYFETVPSNQLEVALWLEADRMGFLLDAVTQKKFEIQRETVKNERGQNYDNRPYGLAREYIAKNLYPYGHPYSWLTIGYLEDLDRVNVDDLKNFFLRWYGPNNAVVTVGGDVTTAHVVELVEKYFGPIPAGPPVEDMELPAPTLKKDRYVHYIDNYIRVPQLYMVFPTVPAYHPDEAPLDCLAEIIGQGKNSIFYKNFEKAEKALLSYAYNPASELAGEFTLVARPYEGLGLAEMEKIMRESLREFEEKGVDADALLRFKASYESGVINSLQSVGGWGGKVSTLAAYETFTGNPDYLQKDLERHLAVTAEDVMRVYEKYIKDKPAVILSILPKGKEDLIAGEDNYEISREGYTAPENTYDGLTYEKAVDDFDRSVQPSPGKNPVITVPDFWEEEMDNGIHVIGTKSEEVPAVTILLTMRGGHMLSAADPGKAGISELTASLMNEDTENYTAEEFSNQLSKLGSTISVSSGDEMMYVYVQTLTKNLAETMELAEERLMRPKFTPEDFNRLKKQQLERIENQNTQPSYLAGKVFQKLLYGEENILGVPSLGTKETVENIELTDVEAFYHQYYSPSLANLVVVGDIEKDQVIPHLDFLESWPSKEVVLPDLQSPPPIDTTRIYLVNVEDAAQSEIRIGYMTQLPYDATGEYYLAGLMNYVLGGAFNSRINLNLREDKGYTYGAFSYFGSSEIAGPFTARAGVRANATDSSVVEFMKELKDYKAEGISPDELAFMKSSIGQRDARKYETLYQKAQFLSTIARYGLDRDFVNRQQAILKALDKNQVDKLAKKHLPVGRMHIVVVGDAKSIRPGLEALGYEVVEVDKTGAVLAAVNE